MQTYGETNSLEEFSVHEEHGIGPRVEQTGQVNEQHLEGPSLLEDEVRHKFISCVKDGSNIENKLCNYYLQTFFELPIRLKFLIKITFSKVTWSSWLNTRNPGMHFAKLTTFLMAGVKHSENSSEIFAPSAVSGFGFKRTRLQVTKYLTVL